MTRIESAAFVVVLDDTSPQHIDDIARRFLHGDGQLYFDKSFQIIVCKNGVSGFNGEHSKLDGLPAARVIDFMSTYKHSPSHPMPLPPMPAPIRFHISDDMASLIRSACHDFAKFCGNFDLKILNWTRFGSSQIKNFKLSPDAFYQMAIQLVHFKLNGHVPVAIYESAQTKKFYCGRTEVGRNLSSDALVWMRAMVDPEVSVEKKRELLVTACKYHTAYLTAACNGQGVDRLLLGLKLIAQENKYPVHPIFEDKGFNISNNWILSTSQVSSPYSYCGYGPVVEDGFGVCYSIRDNAILSSMCCMKSHKVGIAKFHDTMRQTLSEMEMICEARIKANL
eukprot:TRINITY_DN4658_c0_g1_i1.p1 TRINITY_DN4658_c0_g1~~TRINITY_DN4658_c0_g1_i1.p1  ORF type:complete len:337 (-),score=84.37 TRINITY_DN4658_c0_g1_i1:6-1016(-)